MDPMTERLNKLREERLAREKARIEKLRALNLQKYNKAEPVKNSSVNSNSTTNKVVKSEINIKNAPGAVKNCIGAVKNNFHVNGTTKRPITVPTTKPNIPAGPPKPKVAVIDKPATVQSSKTLPIDRKVSSTQFNKFDKKPTTNAGQKPLNIARTDSKPGTLPNGDKKPTTATAAAKKPAHFVNADRKPLPSSSMSRKSLAVAEKPKVNMARKSLAPPKPTQSASKTTLSNNSVFERLYKPKPVHSAHTSDVEKLQSDPNYLKKVIRTAGLILNKRHTVFDTKPRAPAPVRRSISAVHFKRLPKNELGNCIQKWASIGDKLNNVHLKHVNEDDTVKEDKIISAIKSERKKVKFMSPMPNFNTPRPEELQARLKSWLQKRGKSLDSYHHLQCFGIHHLPHSLRFDPKLYDDENKENIAVESDSDDDSYTENMNEKESVDNKWRTASIVSDSVDFNESQNTTTTCSDVVNTDEIVIGALHDLTELLREGFDWEQCARWLRAIRERFPSAPHAAAYWECRAALEERRGDLPASVQCWEEAIAKGTEHSVVEANLDQLLDKFMQLKLSPNSGKGRPQVDSKMVDVKNVFKSTIIRFAVQQAKLRQSNQSSPAPKFCVTPVRRSARLSCHWSGKRTPLQVCTSIRQADEIAGEKLLFVPNDNIHGTP